MDYSQDSEQIRADVASGEYFDQARRWYDELYHRPMLERSFYVILTVLALATILLSLAVYSSMFPLGREVAYIAQTDNIDQDLPLISKLRTRGDQTISEAVTDFLLKDYVTAQESYNYDLARIEQRFNRIRSTSNEAVFGEYRVKMNPENRNSPLNRLGRTGFQTVDIQSLRYDVDGSDGRGEVQFSTFGGRGNDLGRQYWTADIAFRFPPLTVDQDTNEVLQWNDQTKNAQPVKKELSFRVLDYDVRERKTAR